MKKGKTYFICIHLFPKKNIIWLYPEKTKDFNIQTLLRQSVILSEALVVTVHNVTFHITVHSGTDGARDFLYTPHLLPNA